MVQNKPLPDDVPDADAAEQQRPVTEPDLDEGASVEPATEPPLEATVADWQEQLETVEVDPDEFFGTD